MPHVVRAVACLLLLLAADAARADGPLGADGTRILTSDYRLDLGATPRSAGSRVVGLGGAYVAVAEDMDGNSHNPASPAVRPAYSVDVFDYYLGGGITGTNAFKESDLFNSGSRGQALFQREASAILLSGAINLQWRSWGLGLTIDSQTYSLRPRMTAPDDPLQSLDLALLGVRIQVARSLFDGQVIVGGGMRNQTMDVVDQEQETLFQAEGPQYETGLLVRPNGLPFRIGAMFQTAGKTNILPESMLQPDAQGDVILGPGSPAPIYLPQRVVLPWRLDLGLAWQFGPRPLNPRWVDPAKYDTERRRALAKLAAVREEARRARIDEAEARGEAPTVDALQQARERDQEADEKALEDFEEATRRELKQLYASLPRRYLLVSTSVSFLGTAPNAVGVESFLGGVVQRSGRSVTVSPHIGLEAEPWSDRLRVRVGSYFEPSRFSGVDGRIHFTTGFDVRVLDWSVFGLWPDDQRWRVGLVADRAARYFSWGGTLGSWF